MPAEQSADMVDEYPALRECCPETADYLKRQWKAHVEGLEDFNEELGDK